MALFSDIDWIIILAVAAFLLFGRENTAVLRTLGRYYGRAMRMKQELLSEFSRAADLPVGGAGNPVSLRAALLGDGPTDRAYASIPAAVSHAPGPAPRPLMPPVDLGPGTWTLALPAIGAEAEGAR